MSNWHISIKIRPWEVLLVTFLLLLLPYDGTDDVLIRIGGLIQFWVWLFTSVEYKPIYLRGKASKHTGTYVNDKK
jgi:hypothetical protein